MQATLQIPSWQQEGVCGFSKSGDYQQLQNAVADLSTCLPLQAPESLSKSRVAKLLAFAVPQFLIPLLAVLSFLKGLQLIKGDSLAGKGSS